VTAGGWNESQSTTQDKEEEKRNEQFFSLGLGSNAPDIQFQSLRLQTCRQTIFWNKKTNKKNCTFTLTEH
jgi:Flp pilus assembly protein TadG